MEWYVDGQHQENGNLSGSSDTDGFSYNFTTAKTYIVEGNVFDTDGAYCHPPAKWTVNVIIPTGNLNVTVKNQNGSNISGAQVSRYTSNWTPIDEKTTNSSGVVSWSNINAGSYKLEAYYNGEYWINDSVTITAGSTASKTLQRNEPYAYDFKVYNGSTDVTGANVAAGTALRYEVKIRNSSPVSRTVRVKLWTDRNKASSYDFYQTSSSQSVSSSGGIKTFSFYHTPTSTGTYYRQMRVETYVNSNWVKTDSWVWGTAFTAQLITGDLNATLRNVDDSALPDGGTPKLLLYASPLKTQYGSPTTFGGIPTGTYLLEGYFNGNTPFNVYEFWNSEQATIGQGANSHKLIRKYPFASGSQVWDTTRNKMLSPGLFS